MKENCISKMYLSKRNFNFFLSKKLASFCHKNSVLTDYYSSGEYVGYWLCYITKVRASLQHVKTQRCSLFFCRAKTSSSEDNLNG